jgi:hypothetical protein
MKIIPASCKGTSWFLRHPIYLKLTVSTPISYREVPGSKLGSETDYTHFVFSWFSSALYQNAPIVPLIRPQPHSSISFPSHAIIILSFDVI